MTVQSINSSKTLVFLVTAFPPEVSGSAHFNYARAQWLAQQGYRVIVFAPDWHEGSASNLLQENLIVERYGSKPWIPYKFTYVPTIRAAREISRKINAYQPDLIVMTDVERFFLLSAWQLPGRQYAKAQNVPYLAEYHTDVYNFSSTYPGWQWLRTVVRKSRLFSYLYHRLDVTICPSAAASQSCQTMGVNNTRVIPFFGTDISTYSPERRDRQWLAQWLTPAEKNHRIICFLGRLGFEKRVDLLIDAFSQLKQRDPNCSLVIVGDGPVNVVSALKRQAESTADIHFTGFLMGEKKANVLASCDLFCSPSPYETFGLTIVEAMASGVPVVTVNSGAVAEYLIDEENAYLAAPDNSKALAARLEAALCTDNSVLVARSLQQAKHYSVDQGCQNLRDYYQQLLNEQPIAESSLSAIG